MKIVSAIGFTIV